MTHKQIDAARELRLWIRDVLLPVGATAVALSQIPGVKEGAAKTAKSIKDKFTKKKETEIRVIK